MLFIFYFDNLASLFLFFRFDLKISILACHDWLHSQEVLLTYWQYSLGIQAFTLSCHQLFGSEASIDFKFPATSD